MDKNNELSTLTIVLLVVIAVFAVVGVIYNARNSEFLQATDDLVMNLLSLAINLLYLLGGGIIVYGSLLIAIWFIKLKLKNPYKPSGVSSYYAGYLTLSLEFFIGAEIIRTTTTRTWEEFSVLILIIISRGLFSLILYLERRWAKSEEKGQLE